MNDCTVDNIVQRFDGITVLVNVNCDERSKNFFGKNFVARCRRLNDRRFDVEADTVKNGFKLRNNLILVNLIKVQS